MCESKNQNRTWTVGETNQESMFSAQADVNFQSRDANNDCFNESINQLIGRLVFHLIDHFKIEA